MKILHKKLNITVLLFLALLLNSNYITCMAETSVIEKPSVTQTSCYNVSPLEVVANPAKYLKKSISFDAEFVAFTSLGLDYKPAFKDGTKYIGILIKRDDVKDHTIPLSEMKIFVSRELAEKNIDMEAGDKIHITGTVFSNALGDPWVDVQTLKILTQKDKTKKNK